MMRFASAIQCLCLVARFYQLPAESESLIREFQHQDESLDDVNLIRAAKSLSFKAKFVKEISSNLSAQLLPAIARHINGHFFIIAKVTDNEVLIHDLQNKKPTSHTFEELDKIWTSDLLLLTKRKTLLDESVKFGFSWFVPALVKYKAPKPNKSS